MDIQEWVKRDREKKRELFGDVGVHDDCIHYGVAMGKPICSACSYWQDSTNSRKAQVLQCQKAVCYFYEPKRKEDTND